MDRDAGTPVAPARGCLLFHDHESRRVVPIPESYRRTMMTAKPLPVRAFA